MNSAFKINPFFKLAELKLSQGKGMACLRNEISQLRNAMQVQTATQKVENLVILNVVDTLAKNFLGGADVGFVSLLMM